MQIAKSHGALQKDGGSEVHVSDLREGIKHGVKDKQFGCRHPAGKLKRRAKDEGHIRFLILPQSVPGFNCGSAQCPSFGSHK